MITVDGIRHLRKVAEVEINKVLMKLESDTGLKVAEERCSFFAERKKGDKFVISINFESI